MKHLFFLLAFFCLWLASCETRSRGDIKTNAKPATITRISTGSSFGMCIGYCQHEVTITPQLLKSVQKGTRSGELPEKVAEEQLPQSEWNDIISKADWKKFNTLPETIGCPDCADDGAEWVEIQHGDSLKKVTIEFGANVPEMQALLDKLRPIRESFKK